MRTVSFRQMHNDPKPVTDALEDGEFILVTRGRFAEPFAVMMRIDPEAWAQHLKEQAPEFVKIDPTI